MPFSAVPIVVVVAGLVVVHISFTIYFTDLFSDASCDWWGLEFIFFVWFAYTVKIGWWRWWHTLPLWLRVRFDAVQYEGCVSPHLLCIKFFSWCEIIILLAQIQLFSFQFLCSVSFNWSAECNKVRSVIWRRATQTLCAVRGPVGFFFWWNQWTFNSFRYHINSSDIYRNIVSVGSQSGPCRRFMFILWSMISPQKKHALFDVRLRSLRSSW